ncbi:MAG TPA: S-layer family protein, partial [Allocoleopsis sp.]
EGNAGDVVINAADRVLFDGTNADGGLFSSAFSSVGQRGVGRGGNITIDTNSLEVRNGAQLSTGTFGEGNAGDVVINAADRVVFTGTSKAFSTVGAINFRGVAVGNGGDIRIRTDSLEVVRDAQLQASTFARGNAGDVIIHANNRVLFDGTNSTAFSRLEEGAIGRGGRIVINTNSLIVRNGAELTASTFGRGNAGNIRIAARDVSLDGTGNDGFSSGLFTSTTGPTGRGGEITVRADSIRLTDGAVVNAQTFNDFRGGNITLSADTFDATNGGQIITTTTDSGRAGNITLNVTDRVTLSGADRQRTSGLFANTAEGSSGRGGTIRIRTGELNISDRAEIVASSQGSGIAGNIDVTAQSIELDRGRLTAETNTVEGGNIAIATDSLSLTNNAQISVNSVAEDEGGAGNIEVQARNIELDEASEITAETASGQGGNITLSNLELLRLRNGSRISTTAGTQQAGGDGGNISIDADFIVAIPSENSDIRADAFEGRGGNIDITTEGLFGIEARDRPTNFSDITASSELGVQGTININTPDVDPSRGLTELPEDVVDASNQIAQTCPTDG